MVTQTKFDILVESYLSSQIALLGLSRRTHDHICIHHFSLRTIKNRKSTDERYLHQIPLHFASFSPRCRSASTSASWLLGRFFFQSPMIYMCSKRNRNRKWRKCGTAQTALAQKAILTLVQTTWAKINGSKYLLCCRIRPKKRRNAAATANSRGKALTIMAVIVPCLLSINTRMRQERLIIKPNIVAAPIAIVAYWNWNFELLSHLISFSSRDCSSSTIGCSTVQNFTQHAFT